MDIALTLNLPTATQKTHKIMTDAPQKNFGLTYDQFQELVEQLKGGNNALLAQVVAVYYADFRRIIISQGATPHEAYELFADTLIIFNDGLLNGKFGYDNLKSLFTQIGKFIMRGRQRHEKKYESPLSIDEMPALFGVVTQDWDEDKFNALEKTWALLKPDCQERLQQFHVNERLVREIAVSEDMSLNAMLVSLKRCRDFFRTTFFKYYRY